MNAVSMQSLTRITLAVFAIELSFFVCRGHADEPSSNGKPAEMILDEVKKNDAERSFAGAKAAQEVAAIRRQLDLAAQHLEQRQKQLAEFQKQLMEQMSQQARSHALPPLENAELKIFALRSLPASSAANAIEDLFGPKAIRFSIENQSNSLIVLGTQDSLKTIEALLKRLDEEAHLQNSKPPQSKKQHTTRSLLLRLFWLADGLPDGADPAEVLPASVLRATEKLGLVNPRLVAQTVSSLAAGSSEAEEFSANVPALLADHSVDLMCRGKVTLAEADRATVAMNVMVHGKSVHCELKGSLAMPLGHYMVLGTANSVIPKSTTPTDPSSQAPNASRFAFVVQLIPAESFPPEE